MLNDILLQNNKSQVIPPGLSLRKYILYRFGDECFNVNNYKSL